MLISEITKREASLIELCVQAKEAGKAFAEACQFAALAGEKANVVASETEQLSMLFASLPTVQGEVTR